MKNDLQKHAGEFAKALAANQYERTGDERGLYFPKAKAFISGTYIHDVNGQDERADPNLLPDEGLSTLGRWHDSLHRPGSLFAGARPANRPFVPHITLAAVASERAARQIADDWNARRIVIRAVFNALVLGRLEVAVPRFELLARVPLEMPG